jgi:signal transduction histidine kinase
MPSPPSRFRPTIRLRLTLLYGGLFLLAGAVLLALNYGLVRRSLEDRLRPVSVEVAGPTVLEAPLPGQRLPFPGEGDEVLGAAQVIQRLEEGFRDKALHELLVQSSVALGIMVVGSIGLGWVVAGRALRPLAQVTSTARHLSEDNLHQRLDLQGPPDELKELGDTFDAMLGRLESAFDGQRRFVANASHELRTPLSIQRTLVDVALADPDATKEDLRAMAVSVRDAVDRSERLIEGLLVLARSERATFERAPCDLAATAGVALDQVRAEASERAIQVSAHLQPAPLSGNRVLLERLATNLLQNAVRHNSERGWVEVSSSVDRGRGVLRVRNSGPVVPAAEVPALFEPFRRLAPDRTGSHKGVGLGLSIVRAVALAHGGSVEATAPPSGGLDVEVRIPTPSTVLPPAPADPPRVP